jgi:hypothetical protein
MQFTVVTVNLEKAQNIFVIIIIKHSWLNYGLEQQTIKIPNIP